MLDINDIILISVDDHIIEPPDMFDNHLPKSTPPAPRLIHTEDGADVWTFREWWSQRRPSTPWPAGPRRSTASSPRASTRSGPAATTSTNASRT